MLGIGRVVVRVTDLDAATRWYGQTFDFAVLFDEEIFPGFRSVHVGPGGIGDPGIWLFPTTERSSPTQPTEPVLVLYSDDIDADADRLSAVGAEIVQDLQGEPGERSLQVEDPWGNPIVLAERPVRTEPSPDGGRTASAPHH